MPPPDPNTFVRAVGRTIARHGLLLPECTGPLVVATSGGPDSVALLLALDALAREGDGRTDLVVAHLDHGLRGKASEADRAFVEALAERLDRPVETGRADVAAEAARDGVGLEEAGRAARRRFLTDVARHLGASRVAVGHHADDRAETVLFHMLRGTGIAGLAALGPRAPLADGVELIRPLIEVTRADVLAFLRARGETWRKDVTNASAAHTRNRLRHEVLPLVRDAVNPQADAALVRLAAQAGEAADVLADAADEAWKHVARRTPEGDLVFDAEEWAALRPWLQGALVRRAVEALGGGLKHMSAARTAEVVTALLAGSRAGPVDLPGDISAARRGRAIRFAKPAD